MAYLLGFGIPIVYLIVMGLLYPPYLNHFNRVVSLSGDIKPMTVFACIIWPITLPIAVGRVTTNLRCGRGPSRIEKKRAKEIAEAQHKKQLAIISAETLKAKEMEVGIR